MLPLSTKIGLLAPIAWPIPPLAYGAWELVVANLAKGLVAKGYTDITLFATKQASIPGVKTVGLLDQPLGVQPQLGARAYELLHASLSVKGAKGLDILHNHFNYHPLLFSEFVSTPIVTTLHGSAIEEDAKIAYSHYKHLSYVSISNAERALLPELNYISTVYNAVDTNVFSCQPKKGAYLVQTGRMHPQKGVHHAIQLAKAVGLPLYLAGPIQGGYETYFHEQIEPHIDQKNVFYKGNIRSSEVATLVSGAAAFVGLIECDEPFGLATVEAMACGTPVIGMRRGAHEETIIQGETGILVNSLEEAIERFQEVERIDRKHCAESTAQRFSREAMTDGYLAAYEEILS